MFWSLVFVNSQLNLKKIIEREIRKRLHLGLFIMNISRSLFKLSRLGRKSCSSTERRHFDDKTSKSVRFASTIQKTASLYVHWPYCARRCSYCNFNKYVKKKNGKDKLIYTLKARKAGSFNFFNILSFKHASLYAQNCKLLT